MKHLPDEQPAITEHKTEKISPTGKPFSERVEAVPPASGGNEAYPATAAGTGQPGDKPVPQTQGLTQQERTGNNVNADGDSSATGPYSIEGMASSRQVITEVLPEYPAGLNKEAVIKIRFSVLADGTIGEMAPLQKGEALLEEITMRAFRQWRFNALPATAPQTPQPGIITFQYRLHRGNP